MKSSFANRFDNQLVHFQNQLNLSLSLAVGFILKGSLFFALFMSTGQAAAQVSCACWRTPFNIGQAQTDVFTLSAWNAKFPSFPIPVLNSGCIYLNGTLIIDTDFVLNSTSVRLAEGASIIVKSGVSLTLGKSTQLNACTNLLWQGIILENGAKLVVNKATLKGAIEAIRVDGDAQVSVTNSRFIDNIYGLSLSNYSASASARFTCTNNTFGRTTEVWINYEGTPVLAPYIGIAGNHVENMQFSKNKFNGLHCGMLLENSSKIYVQGGLWSNFHNFDGTMGQGIYAGNVTEAVFAEGAYNNVEVGVQAERSDLTFKGNNVNARKYGVLYSHSGGRSLRVLSNQSVIGKETGVFVQKCTVEGNAGSIEIAHNQLIEGETGIAFHDVEIGYTIQENTEVRGYKYDGISLNRCSGLGAVRNNQVRTIGPDGDEALEMIFVKNCQIAGNTFSQARTGIAVLRSTKNVFCCNSLSGLQVGVYFLDSCMQTELRNTTFGASIGTGLILHDNSMISPQLNYGNDWSGSNCQMDALYLWASRAAGPRLENSFSVNSNFLPNGTDKIFVAFTDNSFSNQTDWFKVGGNDSNCPMQSAICELNAMEPNVSMAQMDSEMLSIDEQIEQALEQVSQFQVTERGGDLVDGNTTFVFPNPAKTYFTAQWHDAVSGPVKLTLFKASGSPVMTQVTDATSQQSIFNTSQLSSGTYYLLVQFSDGTATRIKVVIIR